LNFSADREISFPRAEKLFHFFLIPQIAITDKLLFLVCLYQKFLSAFFFGILFVLIEVKEEV